MKGKRTAGLLHSAHCLQLLSPCRAPCPSTHTFSVPPLPFSLSSSPPVYALLTISHGCVPRFTPEDHPLSQPPLSVLTPPPRSHEFQHLPSEPHFPPGVHASPVCPAQCLSSHGPLSATLACFVNNHLFVAGMAAAITSDLPVSSIMDRLLDVNICKSLQLDLPPGRD